MTDNNPLVHLKTTKLGALEQLWLARLSRFNFKTQSHVVGATRMPISILAFPWKDPDMTLKKSNRRSILPILCNDHSQLKHPSLGDGARE